MRNFPLTIVLLLCGLSGISVSVSEFHTVEVQSGEEVTLLCSNFSSSLTQIMWFKVAKRVKPQCICHLFKSTEPAKFCDGFQNGKYEATSNVSNLFLKMKLVELSDSGLYFCGYYITRTPVIVEATYLEVQEFDGLTKWISVILGGLTVVLTTVIIGLLVKNKKLQKGTFTKVYYALTSILFLVTLIRNLRPASEREVETVIYSATT
uniref:Ig-like domain-containing protein n=1 Tax=Monopterus albus TaxID=43700 RepID=A0A3Q3IHU1_MONAL